MLSRAYKHITVANVAPESQVMRSLASSMRKASALAEAQHTTFASWSAACCAALSGRAEAVGRDGTRARYCQPMRKRRGSLSITHIFQPVSF